MTSTKPTIAVIVIGPNPPHWFVIVARSDSQVLHCAETWWHARRKVVQRKARSAAA